MNSSQRCTGYLPITIVGSPRKRCSTVMKQHHSDLAQRLSDEAALIPRRTAIVDRLHERERQKRDDGDLEGR